MKSLTIKALGLQLIAISLLSIEIVTFLFFRRRRAQTTKMSKNAYNEADPSIILAA